MKIKKRLRIAVILIITCGISFFCLQESFAQEWLQIKSGNLCVDYEPGLNLKRLERALRHRYFVSDLRNDYSNPANGPEQRIAYRLEAILSHVKEILGMYPDLPEITIKICRDREELSLEYEKIFNSYGSYKSFYVPKLKTIFTSEQDISDSVIAHELAHAIVDQYFLTVPPAKVAEMISIYVDTHLED